jgi:hypothetical protein
MSAPGGVSIGSGSIVRLTEGAEIRYPSSASADYFAFVRESSIAGWKHS